MKQAKWKIVILILLASIIVILGIALCLQKRAAKAPKSALSLSEFDRYFLMYASQNDVLKKGTMAPINETKNRYRYQFMNDFSLIVSVNNDNNVDKVYYSIKRSAWNKEAMNAYLRILIRAVQPGCTEDTARKLALKMNDITGKEADQLGFLVDFNDNAYQYMTLIKNNDQDLQFFIFLPEA